MEKRFFLFKIALFVLCAVFLISCGGGGDEGNNEISSFTITLATVNVASNSVQISVTANFNGTVPLWKNGVYYDDIKLQSGVAFIYTDSAVVSATQYCYRAGGYALLTGGVWSNLVCVTP